MIAYICADNFGSIVGVTHPRTDISKVFGPVFPSNPPNTAITVISSNQTLIEAVEQNPGDYKIIDGSVVKVI